MWWDADVAGSVNVSFKNGTGAAGSDIPGNMAPRDGPDACRQPPATCHLRATRGTDDSDSDCFRSRETAIVPTGSPRGTGSHCVRNPWP
jgi:hypothetical protein